MLSYTIPVVSCSEVVSSRDSELPVIFQLPSANIYHGKRPLVASSGLD